MYFNFFIGKMGILIFFFKSYWEFKWISMYSVFSGVVDVILESNI